MQELLVRLAAALGSKPIASGAGSKVAKCFAFEAFEDTVISEFRDRLGVVTVTGWGGILIPANKTIYFDKQIGSFTVASGGRGQVFIAV